MRNARLWGAVSLERALLSNSRMSRPSLHVRSLWALSLCAAAALAGACDSSFSLDDDGDGEGGGESPLPTQPSDLPCDVVDVLAACTSCHAGADPSGSVGLVTRADLAASSPADPSVTVADRAVARMQDAARPMPPTGLPGAADVAVLEAWIQSGMPAGDCEGPAPVGVVCSSDQYWTQGDEGSEDMFPGRACISCHTEENLEEMEEEAPRFMFAGTVYPTVHEPNDCLGTGGATVVVTDANGVEHTATVRPSGNFFAELEGSLAFPIFAEVRKNGQVIKMQDAVDSADCNSCHTEAGAEDAPGRILSP